MAIPSAGRVLAGRLVVGLVALVVGLVALRVTSRG
jgi:hypothetical protein